MKILQQDDSYPERQKGLLFDTRDPTYREKEIESNIF
jgi:hypothetical protein